MRMRAGLGFPVQARGRPRSRMGFENSAVYQDAADAFEAWRNAPSSPRCRAAVFRYVNSGMNVLGAVHPRADRQRRGLPYHQTVYGLLADRLGMSQLPALGRHRRQLHRARAPGYATAAGLRQARRALPERRRVEPASGCCPKGWVDYALTTASHTGTSYAACFRTNTDRAFPSLPPEHRLGRPAPPTTEGVRPAPASADRGRHERDRSCRMDLAALEPDDRRRHRHLSPEETKPE